MGILEKREFPRTLPHSGSGANGCESTGGARTLQVSTVVLLIRLLPPLTISRFRFLQHAYFPFFHSPLHSFVTQSTGVSSTLSVSSSALGRFPSQILLQEADQIISSFFFAHLLTEMHVKIRESH